MVSKLLDLLFFAVNKLSFPRSGKSSKIKKFFHSQGNIAKSRNISRKHLIKKVFHKKLDQKYFPKKIRSRKFCSVKEIFQKYLIRKLFTKILIKEILNKKFDQESFQQSRKASTKNLI